jgi:hypothetical protein
MKTLLLKKGNILFLAFIAFFSAQAQDISQTQGTNDMQTMRIEFNSVDGPAVSRQLDLSFSEHTSDEFDEGYDTKNFEVEADDLNLLLHGEPMTEQAYGPITEDKSVPLVLQTSGNYTYTIQLTHTQNMNETDIHLKDNLTGEHFNLKSGDKYEFSSAEGYFPNRFDLIYKTQSVSLSVKDYAVEGLDVYYAFNSNKLVMVNQKNHAIKSLELYNITGKSVYNNQNLNNGATNAITLNNLSTGVYIVRVLTNENGLLTKKIIVN